MLLENGKYKLLTNFSNFYSGDNPVLKKLERELNLTKKILT